MATLAERVAELAATPADLPLPAEAQALVRELLDALEIGAVRAAERDPDGRWRAVPWVKRGILLGFRAGTMADMSIPAGPGARFSFIDKDTFPSRTFAVADGVRVVPGGSTIRRGTYVAPGVVCMPPMFVNVGA